MKVVIQGEIDVRRSQGVCPTNGKGKVGRVPTPGNYDASTTDCHHKTIKSHSEFESTRDPSHCTSFRSCLNAALEAREPYISMPETTRGEKNGIGWNGGFVILPPRKGGLLRDIIP